MIIPTKAGGQGFKVYTLCWNNYILGAHFTSKIAKIDGLKKQKGLPDTSAVCLQLMKLLPANQHVCYLDNFFTRTELLRLLRGHGYAACGTAKQGSGIHPDLVTLREVSKKNQHWGMRTITTVQDEVLCMAWQDNNTVLFMSTAHSVADAERSRLKDIERRSKIPKNAGVWIDDAHSKKALDFPVPIDDYNAHMGGSDGCAQQRSYYSAIRHCDRRYWWPIFQFLLDASVLNSFILYGLDHGHKKDSFNHSEFRRRIGLALVRN